MSKHKAKRLDPIKTQQGQTASYSTKHARAKAVVDLKGDTVARQVKHIDRTYEKIRASLNRGDRVQAYRRILSLVSSHNKLEETLVRLEGDIARLEE